MLFQAEKVQNKASENLSGSEPPVLPGQFAGRVAAPDQPLEEAIGIHGLLEEPQLHTCPHGGA